MTIEASDFQSRKDMDSFVLKEEVTLIQGKREDLQRLNLSDKDRVYGVKVQITDTPTDLKKPFINTKVNRNVKSRTKRRGSSRSNPKRSK